MKKFNLNKVFGGKNFYHDPFKINDYLCSKTGKWIKSKSNQFSSPITNETLVELDNIGAEEFNCSCYHNKSIHNVDFSLIDFIEE